MNTEHYGLICWGISQCDPVFQCSKHNSIRDYPEGGKDLTCRLHKLYMYIECWGGGARTPGTLRFMQQHVPITCTAITGPIIGLFGIIVNVLHPSSVSLCLSEPLTVCLD